MSTIFACCWDQAVKFKTLEWVSLWKSQEREQPSLCIMRLVRHSLALPHPQSGRSRGLPVLLSPDLCYLSISCVPVSISAVIWSCDKVQVITTKLYYKSFCYFMPHSCSTLFKLFPSDNKMPYWMFKIFILIACYIFCLCSNIYIMIVLYCFHIIISQQNGKNRIKKEEETKVIYNV